MTVPGQPTVTYTYDALDRRTSRSAGGTSETYGYVGLSATVGRIDRGGGQVLASAIDALGDRLTVGSSWVLPSVRGDVAALLAPGGTAVGDAHRYDPYGVTLAASGSTASPWRFAGRLQEPTSGQYDYGARGYDPALAAFTSLDTALGAAAAPASRNRYLYAEANPVSMVDPDGHAACRLGADDCADLGGRLDALARAAAAADAAAAAALATATRAAAAADLATARASEPCRLGDPDGCAAWRHSRSAAADRARAAARAAWTAAGAALARARAAHRALAQARARLGTKPKGRGRGPGSAPSGARPPAATAPPVAAAAGVRPAGERNRDFARCALGPEPRPAGAAWSAACDRVNTDAAALTPACGLLGTRCLKDLAGALSVATGTAALAIEVGTLGLGTPVSTMLGLVSVGTGAYSTLGTCLYDGGSSCGVSIVGTTFAAAAPAGGALRAVGVVGRDAATAWHLTFEFMAMPFGLTGPLLWLEEALPR